jgi:hypothetical protein
MPPGTQKWLVVAPAFHEWDLGHYVRDVLSRQGFEVSVFAYQPYPSQARELQHDLLQQLDRDKPGIVLALKADRVPPDALQQMRNRGAFVVLWYVDCISETPPSWILPLLEASDLFLTTAKGMVPVYRHLGTTPSHWLIEGVHLPFFPARVGRVPALYRSVVVFLGSIYNLPEEHPDFEVRARFFKAVQARYPFKVWGPQGTPASRERYGESYPVIEWPAYNEEVTKICQASDIVLGRNSIQSVELYFSNRTYLVLAAGGFHLTAYVPGLETMFRNHEHLVWYESLDDCLEKIDYYLQRPRLRQAIASAGQTWTRHRYSMTRQINQMRRLIDKYR